MSTSDESEIRLIEWQEGTVNSVYTIEVFVCLYLCFIYSEMTCCFLNSAVFVGVGRFYHVREMSDPLMNSRIQWGRLYLMIHMLPYVLRV